MHKGWAILNLPLYHDLQWFVVFPLLINPLSILYFERNVELCLRGRHSSHLVPWKIGPGDEILNKLWPHNHKGYAWLIYFLLGTFRKWGHLLIPVWKGVLLGECPVLLSIRLGFYIMEIWVHNCDPRAILQKNSRFSRTSVLSLQIIEPAGEAAPLQTRVILLH
jgi:hypothetical protein